MSQESTWTERLLLREPTLSDLESFCDMHCAAEADPLVYGSPFSRQTIASWLQLWMGRWKTDGFSYWTVCLAENAEVPIGVGGVTRQPIGPFEGANLYFRIAGKYQGHGYGKDLAQAALRFAFCGRQEAEVFARVHPDHRLSRRILKSIGMTPQQILPQPADVLFYRMTALEYGNLKKGGSVQDS